MIELIVRHKNQIFKIAFMMFLEFLTKSCRLYFILWLIGNIYYDLDIYIFYYYLHRIKNINFRLYSIKYITRPMKHSQLKVNEDVFKLFSETQKLTTTNKAIVFELVKIFRDKPKQFMFAFEQAFLKVFKSCHSKANKKIPSKFQNLAQAIFRQLLVFGDPQWQSNKVMAKSVQFFNNFLDLNIEAISSSIMNIRIMGARNAFMVVKLIPQQFLSRVLKPQIQENFVTAIYQLLRLRVSTYRQLGAKLSSLVQTLNIPKIELIQNEMFRIASIDDNEQIRKMVITNILITKNNVDKILVRLRDKNAQLRAIILRKLQTEKYLLDKNAFNLSQIYKILYDGFGSKDQSVKKQSINFYLISFGEDDYERKQRKSMFAGHQKNFIKMELQNQSVSIQLKSINNPKFLKFSEFVETFNPNILMVNPHLCNLFDELIQKMIQQLSPELVSDYIRNLCHRLRYCSSHPSQFSNQQLNQLSMEIIWLKNCIKTNVRDVTLVFESLCPTGLQLGKLLQTFIERKNLYGSYELLRYFEKQAQQMPDQVSRNKMFDSLKKVLSKMNYFSAIYTACSEVKTTKSNNDIHQTFYETPTNLFKNVLSEHDDIAKIPSGKDLNTHKLMVSYYNLPIISSSLDLIHYISIVMKILRPEHYEIEIKQTMAEWNDPQDRTLQKQRQLVLANINKIDPNFNIQKNYSDPMMIAFLERLRKVQIQMEENKQKTKIVILTLGKLNPNSDIQIYMPIIKDYLSRKNQSYGLLMLSFYCLYSIDRMQNFLLIYWKNIFNHQINFDKEPYAKDNILVSLRIFIDFIIKFDILKQNITINEQISRQFPGLTYNTEAFMEIMYQLLLHKDPQIRILAVQSMCRLFYHEKIDTSYQTMSLTYLLLLWWSTDDEQTTAKCVHLISIFVKGYVDFNMKGINNMGKFVQGLCIFFKLIMEQFKNRKTINKAKIVYNLKLDEFIKRAIAVSVNILKAKPKKNHGKKQRRQTFEQLADNLKPQQLFILFLLQQDGFQGLIDKALNTCDFIEYASLEVLILTKKILEKMRDDGRVIKKNQSVISKFQSETEEAIRNKNVSDIDQILLNGLQKELQVNCQMFTEELKKMIPKIQAHELFIQNQYEDQSSQSSVIQSQDQSGSSEQQQQSSQSDLPQIKKQQQSRPLRRKRVSAQLIMDLSDQFDKQNDQSSLIPKKRQVKKSTSKKKQTQKNKTQKQSQNSSEASKSENSYQQNITTKAGKKQQKNFKKNKQPQINEQEAVSKSKNKSLVKGPKQDAKKKGDKKQVQAIEPKIQQKEPQSSQNKKKKELKADQQTDPKSRSTRNTRKNPKTKN